MFLTALGATIASVRARQILRTARVSTYLHGGNCIQVGPGGFDLVLEGPKPYVNPKPETLNPKP